MWKELDSEEVHNWNACPEIHAFLRRTVSVAGMGETA